MLNSKYRIYYKRVSLGGENFSKVTFSGLSMSYKMQDQVCLTSEAKQVGKSHLINYIHLLKLQPTATSTQFKGLNG